jgi:hypothetical protein
MPNPKPDDYGRLRVRDKDTGHKSTIPAEKLHLGDYEVLKTPASDVCGDPLPVEYATPKVSPVEPTNSGQQAESQEGDA